MGLMDGLKKAVFSVLTKEQKINLVINKLSSSLQHLINSYDIPAPNIRVKIYSPDGSGNLEFAVLNGGKQVASPPLHFILECDEFDDMIEQTNKFLGQGLAEYAFQHEVPLRNANLRVYCNREKLNQNNKQEIYPALAFCEGVKLIKDEITIADVQKIVDTIKENDKN